LRLNENTTSSARKTTAPARLTSSRRRSDTSESCRPGPSGTVPGRVPGGCSPQSVLSRMGPGVKGWDTSVSDHKQNPRPQARQAKSELRWQRDGL
jgi:hypothetical protein